MEVLEKQGEESKKQGVQIRNRFEALVPEDEREELTLEDSVKVIISPP